MPRSLQGYALWPLNIVKAFLGYHWSIFPVPCNRLQKTSTYSRYFTQTNKCGHWNIGYMGFPKKRANIWCSPQRIHSISLNWPFHCKTPLNIAPWVSSTASWFYTPELKKSIAFRCLSGVLTNPSLWDHSPNSSLLMIVNIRLNLVSNFLDCISFQNCYIVS